MAYKGNIVSMQVRSEGGKWRDLATTTTGEPTMKRYRVESNDSYDIELHESGDLVYAEDADAAIQAERMARIKAEEERDELRAKLTEIQQQEPAAMMEFYGSDGSRSVKNVYLHPVDAMPSAADAYKGMVAEVARLRRTMEKIESTRRCNIEAAITGLEGMAKYIFSGSKPTGPEAGE